MSSEQTDARMVADFGEAGVQYPLCAHGHELVPDNVYMRRDRYGAPACRTCRNETAARFRARRDANKPAAGAPVKPLISRNTPEYEVSKIDGVWHRRRTKSKDAWLPVVWAAEVVPNNPPRGRREAAPIPTRPLPFGTK